MPASVDYRALGSVELLDCRSAGARPVSLQPKQLAILTYLAGEHPGDRPRTRDILVRIFWPESDESHARAALRQAIYEIRKGLGDAVVQVGAGNALRMDPDQFRYDVWSFHRAMEAGDLERAIALRRGPFLEGFLVSGAPEFEEWAESQRNGLDRRYRQALESASKRSVDSGNVTQALEHAHKWAREDPYSGRAICWLISVQELCSDRAAALHVAEQYEVRLREDLGAEPDPEVLALATRIRNAPVSPQPHSVRDTGSLGLLATDQDSRSAALRAFSGLGWRSPSASRIGLALVVILVALITTTAWLALRSRRMSWALNTALPELQRLVDHRQFVAAYQLAQQAEPYLHGNQEFQRLQKATSFRVSIDTTPAGARIYVGDYAASDDRQIFLGISPLVGNVPAGYLRFRIEKPGFQVVEAARVAYPDPVLSFTLEPITERPDMIRVPAGGMLQHPPVPPPRELQPFWLDRYEVTNRDFMQFIARRGYRERRFWTHPIVADGKPVSWKQGIAAFADRTGRIGPSTWMFGRYPEGTGAMPVGGVSWYEAAAYCESIGKQLPTFHHWFKAAGMVGFSSILPISNLGGPGPEAVGAYRGIGPFGHYDMAGNVREWAVNAVGDRRYILGGAWSDPSYMFYTPDAAWPWDRSSKNGFRCASYDPESAPVFGAELDFLTREYNRVPVDDAEFRLYRTLYAYDPSPLDPRFESLDEQPAHWRHETVSFEAPYGGERQIAHLFLPRVGDPPYHAVVFYPGAQAWTLDSSSDMETRWFDFIVRTGRAVLLPEYEGTFGGRRASGLLRERVIHWTMDISRSIDYLETRNDIDDSRLAYYGFSTGAWRGPIFTAVETRFKASILLSGGVMDLQWPPEIDPINFAPRTTVPVLMVNGRDDFFFPFETSQRELFRLLGTRDEDKKHFVVEGGHIPPAWQDVVREVLDWLDVYLGPVGSHL